MSDAIAMRRGLIPQARRWGERKHVPSIASFAPVPALALKKVYLSLENVGAVSAPWRDPPM